VGIYSLLINLVFQKNELNDQVHEALLVA